MVTGLDVFRDWFKGFEDCYTLIGGAACDLWMGDRGLGFRATKDLDVVLVFDGQRPDFVRRLWAFVKAAGYEGYTAGEVPQNYYRLIEQLPPEAADWQAIKGSLKSASDLMLPTPTATIESFRKFFALD